MTDKQEESKSVIAEFGCLAFFVAIIAACSIGEGTEIVYGHGYGAIAFGAVLLIVYVVSKLR